MMKKFFFLFFSCFLSACAGTPPAWWNPSGSYGAERPDHPQQTASVATSLPAAVTAEEEEPYPIEQTIEPAMESYEELDLSPFAQTVEVSAVAPEEAAPAAAEQTAVLEEASQRPVSAADDQPAVQESEEYLPADGSLPPPSVLQ